jgi:hypothetical protein
VSLIVMGDDYAGLRVNRKDDGFVVTRFTCPNAVTNNTETSEASAAVSTGTLWLRVSVQRGPNCSFSYSTDGMKFKTLGRPFQARASRWMGAKVGLLCSGNGGHADFDWLHIEPLVRAGRKQ